MISRDQKVRRARRLAALAATAALLALPAAADAGALRVSVSLPDGTVYTLKVLESSFVACPSTAEDTWTDTPVLAVGTDSRGTEVHVLSPYTAVYCDN